MRGAGGRCVLGRPPLALAHIDALRGGRVARLLAGCMFLLSGPRSTNDDMKNINLKLVAAASVLFIGLLGLIGGLVSGSAEAEEEKQVKQPETGAKPELIYAVDPLCGWCYGFSPVMRQIRKDFAGKVEFRIMSGGLATGDMAAPLKENYEYIKNALTVVERSTGVKFGQPFRDLLEEGSYFNDSEPPSIALTVVKEMKPEIAFDYGHKLHSTIFMDGKSLNDAATYRSLAAEFQLDQDEFMRKFTDSAYKARTNREFDEVKRLGVRGFPSLVLRKGNKIEVITRGYESYPSVKSKLDKVL
jgi:putative protein-disulfide isomerase